MESRREEQEQESGGRQHGAPQTCFAKRGLAAQEKLAAGENVVLLANHQTEADPQVPATVV